MAGPFEAAMAPTALLRRVSESRQVVGCDVVELAPAAGLLAPALLCARLTHKLLGCRFDDEVRRR
jgi:arginase family enzyme